MLDNGFFMAIGWTIHSDFVCWGGSLGGPPCEGSASLSSACGGWALDNWVLGVGAGEELVLALLFGVFGVEGGFRILWGAGRFWQELPFWINLLNCPEIKPMFATRAAHWVTFTLKASLCSSVGPVSLMPENVLPSMAPLSSALTNSL